MAIVGLLMKGCYNKLVYENEISGLNDKLVKQDAELKTTIQKDSSKLYVMEQKLMDERHARILAEDASKRFKTLSSVVKTWVEVRRDTIWIPFADSGPLLTSPEGGGKDSANISIAYNDKWFYLGGKMKQTGLLLDSIGFNAGYMNVLIGEQRRGLFKKPLPIVELQVENPYMHITTANNVVVKDTRKKPVLLSRTAMLVYGIVLGSILIW
ncbi:MAG: hypothetical protein M0D57_21085 [Sphingobacteriales bacterium JAD_PAG50586_3]|nr:MAG: hypothetical protein M0D57_21085 [Sphingobacteriales bacterium JAD_PAG50586_3]